MLIVNADDWGGWRSATDFALECFQAGRVTSVSAMVHMEDSQRGAEIARKFGVSAGLHLNLNQDLTDPNCPTELRRRHRRISRFLHRSKYALLVFNPLLRVDFRVVFECQYREFERLYGRSPTHIDGHRHMHLCTNLLVDRVLPSGVPVRRSFSFWPGEKSAFNRAYRRAVDWRIAQSHRVTKYFFAASQSMESARLDRVMSLASRFPVELMTHPEHHAEFEFLQSPRFGAAMARVRLGNYEQL